MDEDVIDRLVADACEAAGHRWVVVRYPVHDHGDGCADVARSFLTREVARPEGKE